MENLIPKILEFIGASAIYAPLTLALIWFIRWTVKGTDWPHWYKMVFSCGVISGLFFALALLSWNSGHFDGWGSLLLDQFWVWVWFVIGLFAWGPKPETETQ